MKLIDKMLMECKPTPARLSLAMITVKPEGGVSMVCCLVDGSQKEVKRITSHHADEQAARRELAELVKQYPDDVPPVVIVDDIADVMLSGTA